MKLKISKATIIKIQTAVTLSADLILPVKPYAKDEIAKPKLPGNIRTAGELGGILSFIASPIKNIITETTAPLNPTATFLFALSCKNGGSLGINPRAGSVNTDTFLFCNSLIKFLKPFFEKGLVVIARPFWDLSFGATNSKGVNAVAYPSGIGTTTLPLTDTANKLRYASIKFSKPLSLNSWACSSKYFLLAIVTMLMSCKFMHCTFIFGKNTNLFVKEEETLNWLPLISIFCPNINLYMKNKNHTKNINNKDFARSKPCWETSFSNENSMKAKTSAMNEKKYRAKPDVLKINLFCSI